ncbi:MAG: cysteine desulfurase [Candidatus Marinimicrobia bacterium]|nr:cysteine desulfurase [Candidatus Neomarinimicrobiota bacterium]
MSSFDVETIRKDFPILSTKVHDKPLVYLDNAATTQKPNSVIEIMNEYMHNHNANVHRGIHLLSEKSTEGYENARIKVANFFNASQPEEIIFTKGTTESINLVAHAWGRKFISEGDIIILSEMEHHSNLVPWQLLAKSVGAELKFVEMNEDTTLNLESLKELVSDKRAKLVALSYASNVLGNVNPVKEVIEISHSENIPVLLDGAQAAPHHKIDFAEIDCDFFACSAHKMLGPTGIGILYAKMELLEAMDPFLGGGEMILEVGLHESSYKEPPYKFEAGTPSYIEAIGFGAAIDYLKAVGMDSIHDHEANLSKYALGELKKLGDVEVYGPLEGRAGIISFNIGNAHPHDVAQLLDADGVAVRAGHHCAQPLMNWLKVSSTSRASFYLYNTESEVDVFVESLDKIKEMFN